MLPPLLALMEGNTPAEIRLSDPKVRGSVEEPRLTNQCQLILARLKQGPASNTELANIATRFGARVHDLRSAGYNIVITHRDRRSGLTFYALEA